MFVREKVTRLLTAFADEFKEVSEISAGNIAVAVGLKQVQCYMYAVVQYIPSICAADGDWRHADGFCDRGILSEETLSPNTQ